MLVICLIILFSRSSSSIPNSKGDISTYFCHMHDCNAVFIDAIASSTSATCAFFDLNNEKIEQTLLNNDVSLVLDEQSKHKPKTSNLFLRIGEGLMHHKFCIINNSFIITGSYNPTHVFSPEGDFNTLISIQSDVLAEFYLRAHTSLQTTRKKSSKQNKVLHNGFLIEVYFCPQDNCQDQILRTLNSAKKSISFALFTFTDKQVASILKNKFREGLAIDGIVESYQSKTYNQYFPLVKAGLNLSLETSNRLQHTKLFVIDESIVILGSYNPTNAANTINDENILIIHNADIALLYEQFIQEILFISSLS